MASTLYIQLDYTRKLLDLYALPVIFILGNVTNVINVHIFPRRNMRVNACSWYFVCLSLAHLLLLNISCLPRIIIAWTEYDYAIDNSIYCRIRVYLFNLSILLARQFLTLISIDRWLVTSSSAWLRKQSSPKTTRWMIIGSVVFWSLYTIHVLVGYGSNRNGCFPSPGTVYSTFTSIDAVVTAILPLVSDSLLFS